MTISRKQQICLEETPYYHCISRCVRRAFLCGKDDLTGRSYEHRRDWIVEKLKQLDGVFSISICAYAVMHNHTHTVLKIDREAALNWCADEVISRWTRLYKPSPIVDRYLNGIKLTKAELDVVAEDIEKWRHRLYDVSWFMRNLNESIAREANEEDNCTGKFWEGRFKSQALLDDAALLTCMSYVDLNPIRAKIADRAEESDFTSIQERIRHYQKALEQTGDRVEAATTAPVHLLPFVGGEHQEKISGLNFSLPDYLELTDWVGRAIREDKSGAIPSELVPILERLNIDPEAWLDSVKNYGKNYNTVIGTRKGIKQFSQAIGRKWFCSSGYSLQIYQTSHV
ncbi:MAG: transposase [Candidatus Thiodiazotropha sp. (ex Lucinoma borealis)]|nr:transposase [Candidatus Thiodiazotropha sp. (ex Lucinoma borealis)]MCU7862916.1 transposase [Candidatus Thiodiazotropha sp. (ex Lucinoma borealis)]MCU7870953.1 transposase [Candidatus Thiodiazotropha sp. (ex Lucinoma borealis)]